MDRTYEQHLITISRASGITQLNWQGCGNPILEYLPDELLAAYEFFRDLRDTGAIKATEDIVERYHKALSDILSLFVASNGWDYAGIDEALDVLAENMHALPTGMALVERIEQRKREREHHG